MSKINKSNDVNNSGIKTGELNMSSSHKLVQNAPNAGISSYGQISRPTSSNMMNFQSSKKRETNLMLKSANYRVGKTIIQGNYDIEQFSQFSNNKSAKSGQKIDIQRKITGTGDKGELASAELKSNRSKSNGYTITSQSRV